jgi:membrane protease YdiL (CAAX protease family)
MKTVGLFFLIFIPLAAAFEAFTIWSGFSNPSVTLLMWSPGIAAILALKLQGKTLSSLGWHWGPAKYHWVALGLPIVYGVIAFTLAGVFGLAEFATPELRAAFAESGPFAQLGQGGFTLLLTVITIFAATTITSMARALGEEIGWRGFLTPRLTAAFGFAIASVLTGLVWAAWHTPVMWLSGYNGGGDRVWETAAFVINVVSISGVFAWLRLKSGSLWPATTLHAAHNVFIQLVLNPLSARGEGDITMVGEFGIVLALVTAAVSVPFWIMGIREALGRNADPEAA